VVERGLHFRDGLQPGTPAFDPEMFGQQRAVQVFDDAGGPGPAGPNSRRRGTLLRLFDNVAPDEQITGVSKKLPALAASAAFLGTLRAAATSSLVLILFTVTSGIIKYIYEILYNILAFSLSSAPE